MICKYTPMCPVIAVCQTAACARRLSLVRGVIPLHRKDLGPQEAHLQTTFDAAIEFGIQYALQNGLAKSGDAVVITCTDVFAGSHDAAMMKIRTL